MSYPKKDLIPPPISEVRFVFAGIGILGSKYS
jgi:hypothetical protein